MYIQSFRILTQASPSGKRVASIRASDKDKEIECVIITINKGNTQTFDLKSLGKHGKVGLLDNL